MRIVHVHAHAERGLFGDAAGAICSGGKTSLFEIPGPDQHVGIAQYRAVVRALELAVKAGEPFEVCTSYQVIATQLKNGRCGSAAMRPHFEKALELIAESGSRVRYLPSADNVAVRAVLGAYRSVGRAPRPVRAPARARRRSGPDMRNLPPALRAALIEAGWTPPDRHAVAV